MAGLSPSWWAAGVLVVAGWIAGFFLWRVPDSSVEFGVYVDAWIPGLMLVLGAPAAVIAAGLRSSGGAWSVVGSVVMVLAAVGLAYLASCAHWGGRICLDPDDNCITTWPSRGAVLGVAIAIIAAAGGFERFCQRALSRRAREE